MIKNIERGCFITLEGGEGAGKSTQIRHLAERLKERRLDVLITREPGGTPGGEAIRHLLVNGDTGRWQPMTEALLHTAARVEHVQKVIEPALSRGVWVISDRFADSTRAYQGAAQGLSVETVDDLQRLALGTFAPDLTLILDLPVTVALERTRERGAGAEDRYERMGNSFHERLRAAFLGIARNEPVRCRVIDASGSVEEVASRVWTTVRDALIP
ncbi:MAG: dTMP kinase [Proteobacteria bacterium]|nr:MAG: dTMP kinase [Pseudomonadota bacterium]